MALLAAVALGIAAPAAIGTSADGSEVALKRGSDRIDSLPAHARPLFSSKAANKLKRRAKALHNTAPDLMRWYRVPANNRGEARREAARIERDTDHQAHVIGPGAPPPSEMCRVAPEKGWPEFSPGGQSPSLVPFQDYRAGLGIDQAHDADGHGVEIAVVEYSWNAEHESIAHHDFDPPYYEFWWNHGNAVLSVLGGRSGNGGATGLVPEAKLSPRSPIAPSGYDLPGTIVQTGSELDVGDVLLIEQQAWVAAYEQEILGPVEIDPAARDAIDAVVASGVIVVEPAGNNSGGGLDLDDLGLEGDSGALIVSAGGSPQHDDNGHRAGFSNYGERIDFHAQGEALVSAGYGDINPSMPQERHYSACFGGTSGAAAIMAATVAGVQSAAIAHGHEPLTPPEMRQRLAIGALPQHEPDEGLIGPQPWLPAAADFRAPDDPELLTPKDGAVLESTDVTLAWETDDGVSGGSDRLDDEIVVDGRVVARAGPGGGSLVLELPVGEHQWAVRSRDAAGNTTASSSTFSVTQVVEVPRGHSNSDEAETSGANPPPPGGQSSGGDQIVKMVADDSLALPKVRPRLTTRPAARSVRSTWRRRDGRLTLRFRGIAPGAVVRVSGKRARVKKGKATMIRKRQGRVRVTVSARRRGSIRYRSARFTVRVGPPQMKRRVASKPRNAR